MCCLTSQPVSCGVGPMAREATVVRRPSRVMEFSMVTGSHNRLQEITLISGNYSLASMTLRQLKHLNSTMRSFQVTVTHSRDHSLSNGAEPKSIRGMSLLLDSMISSFLIPITITSCLLSVTRRILLEKLLGYFIMISGKLADQDT
jgi:hypothetical protein